MNDDSDSEREYERALRRLKQYKKDHPHRAKYVKLTRNQTVVRNRTTEEHDILVQSFLKRPRKRRSREALSDSSSSSSSSSSSRPSEMQDQRMETWERKKKQRLEAERDELLSAPFVLDVVPGSAEALHREDLKARAEARDEEETAPPLFADAERYLEDAVAADSSKTSSFCDSCFELMDEWEEMFCCPLCQQDFCSACTASTRSMAGVHTHGTDNVPIILRVHLERHKACVQLKVGLERVVCPPNPPRISAITLNGGSAADVMRRYEEAKSLLEGCLLFDIESYRTATLQRICVARKRIEQLRQEAAVDAAPGASRALVGPHVLPPIDISQALPEMSNWRSDGRKRPFLYPVGLQTAEGKATILRFIESSCSPGTLPSLRVREVFRVENAALVRKYATARQHLLLDLGASSPVALNERDLFHGTSHDTVQKIVEEGFEPRLSNRAMYGNGCYFARDSMYSAQPSYARPCRDGISCMFLARVLVGRSVVGKLGARRPVLNDVPVETFVDALDNPAIVVTSKLDYAVPLYLIKFQRA